MIENSLRKLKYAATINDDVLIESTDPDFEIEYIDIGNVDSSGAIRGVVTYRFEDAPSRARRVVQDGDVIVSTVRTYLKAIAPIVDPARNLIVSTGFAVIRPKAGELDPKFCRFALREPSFLAEVEKRSVGISYPAINSSEVGLIPIPLPLRLDDQRAIADFLDTETARIDALIAAKVDMLNILAEKRRALVTRAVTRGLDPSVPMRDSGIPWLGKIPQHWEMTRLKFLLEGIEQGWSPQCDNFPAGPGEWGVVKTGCVNGDTFDETENKRLPDDLEPRVEYEIRPGDFLMSRANTTALVGSAALVGGVRSKLLLCDKIYRLRVNHRRLDSQFLEMFFNTPVGRYEFERDATGASGSMQNISQEAVQNIRLAVPPKDEQAQIVNATRLHLARADAVASTTQGTVALLHERREAIIAAVVTGRLEVEAA